jgi:MYXO-CTERM domain-containing protein
MSRRLVAIATMLALIAILAWTSGAQAASPCGGESDLAACGVANPCGCCAKAGETWPDGTCGNCVWHAWYAACDGWNVAVPWTCSDGKEWNELAANAGYLVDGVASASSIFVCEASSVWSTWGHVGWIESVNTDGSSNTTEQFCSSTNCGTFHKVRAAGFADAYIHHESGPPPVGTDNAKFVSETIPDGTKLSAGETFTKRWTMKNSGTSTWTKAEGYSWKYISGEQFGAAAQTDLTASASVGPSGSYDWDVPMTAPSSQGTYKGYWQMSHDGKGVFGEKVWVEIVVVSGPAQDAGTKDSSTGQDAASQPDTGTQPGKDASATDGSAGSTQSDGAVAPAKDGGASGSLFNKSASDDSGCGCRTGSTGRSGWGAAWMLLAGACLMRRKGR